MQMIQIEMDPGTMLRTGTVLASTTIKVMKVLHTETSTFSLTTINLKKNM